MKGTMTIVTALFVLTSVPAFAAAETTEKVTVVPPYVVTKATTGLFNRKQTSITISRNVGYGDLDLNTPQGQSALQSRVREAAAGVCNELDRRYGATFNTPAKSGNCIQTASADAMMQARSGGARAAMQGGLGGVKTASNQ